MCECESAIAVVFCFMACVCVDGRSQKQNLWTNFPIANQELAVESSHLIGPPVSRRKVECFRNSEGTQKRPHPNKTHPHRDPVGALWSDSTSEVGTREIHVMGHSIPT